MTLSLTRVPVNADSNKNILASLDRPPGTAQLHESRC